MRKSLYVKDEDCRHSFLYGNYVTLASMQPEDLERITELGLSPLYISVHAADPRVRRSMLRNRRAPDIMQQLRFLADNGIALHTQIVVCPGVNDGEVLSETVEQLLGLGEALQSIAVVPVGITRFSTNGLRLLDAGEAGGICHSLMRRSDGDREQAGVRRLFLADELFLRAGLPIPPAAWYEDFPQIENGVGLLRMLLDEADELSSEQPADAVPKGPVRLLLLTSVSAEASMREALGRVARRWPGVSMHVMAVENRFFGPMVSVAGLLTARDIIRTARSAGQGWDGAVIPSAMLNFRGHTLDGYSLARIRTVLGRPVIAASGIRELEQQLGRFEARECSGRNGRISGKNEGIHEQQTR
jgi:putative radical SAM enzyme (TIGR03279 family)